MGLSSQLATLLQIYLGRVQFTGSTGPNGDSRIMDPADEPLANMRTETTRPWCSNDVVRGGQLLRVLRQFAALKHSRGVPSIRCRVPLITLNRYMVIDCRAALVWRFEKKIRFVSNSSDNAMNRKDIVENIIMTNSCY